MEAIMFVDVSKELKTISGDVMKDTDSKGNAISATVKMAIVNAILSPDQKDKGVDKVRKYELAKRVHTALTKIDLSPEEIVLIKDTVGELYAPIVVGQIFDLLK
jgi:hypothetical protein